MSLRPRRVQKVVDKPAGSIFGAAIDVKPVQDVGINIINNDKPGAYFVVEMYFGKIGTDDLFVMSETFPGQKYLRFRINLLGARSGRKSFAAEIEKAVKPRLGQGFGDAVHTDSYVCGSPANSFYVISFPQTSASTASTPTFALDPTEMAKAITGKNTGETFSIDTDGFKYKYTVNGSDPKFSMTITRQS